MPCCTTTFRAATVAGTDAPSPRHARGRPQSLWRLCSAGLLAALCAGQAFAQATGGSTVTQAKVDGSTVAACSQSASGTSPLLDLSCNVPSVAGAQVQVMARAQAPTAYDPANPAAYALAELGATAHLVGRARGFPGNNAPAEALYAPALNAFASASFLDYLQLGNVRPTSLELRFDLDGTLAIGALMPSPGADARVSYAITVQSGRYSALDQSFGSLGVFGAGSVVVDRQLSSPGGTAVQAPPTVQGVQLAQTVDPLQPNTTHVTVTLGSAFFSNPVNDLLLLDFRLSASANAPAVVFSGPAGDDLPQVIQSDFGSTLAFVGLTAFDGNGADITGEAIRGFASISAVPEPAMPAMLAAGLCVVGWLARSKRRAARAAAPARPGTAAALFPSFRHFPIPLLRGAPAPVGLQPLP